LGGSWRLEASIDLRSILVEEEEEEEEEEEGSS
jgi:hypothetical protein